MKNSHGYETQVKLGSDPTDTELTRRTRLSFQTMRVTKINNNLSLSVRSENKLYTTLVTKTHTFYVRGHEFVIRMREIICCNNKDIK